MHWRMTQTQFIMFLITLYLVSHINTFASEDKTRKDDKNEIARHNIIASIKAGGGRGGGGRSRSGGAGSENGGTGSGSSSSRTPGRVIPVYAGAGARGHHNSGNRWQGNIGLVAVFSATILSSLFMFI